MGKSRKKKNADFKKVKLKIGRRLPKGKDVDLSFATKKICIREEKPLLNDSSGQRVLHLSRIVPRLHSRHNEELVSGLTDLKLWMKQNPAEARQLLLMEMQTAIVPLMRHIEAKVRDVARQVFTSLLHLVNNTPSYYPSLAQGMFSALVHIDVGVRATGWEYLRLMVEVAPRVLPALNCSRLLDELSRRVPQESVGLSSKRAGNVKLIERLLTILSTASSADGVDQGPLKVDGMLVPTRDCIFDWDAIGADRMWKNGHVSRAIECGLGWAGEETYSVTDFLSDLSTWFAGRVAEFQSTGECREEAMVRLLSLLAILKTALRHHIFVQPLSTPSLGRFADCVTLLWQLFPLAEDAVIFRTANMAILHVKCLQLVATGGGAVNKEEDRKLGEYFNSSMPALWPPSRSLCLQWTAMAELCLRPQLVTRRGKWTSLLVSIVSKIADCNAQRGSKVGSLCRQIVSLHRDMVASCETVE